MPDFFLEADDRASERSDRRRPGRLVSSGLHPEAAVPPSRQPAHPPVSGPCEGCGALVVLGATVHGTRLALDLHVKTYTLSWSREAPPVLHESRGYPVHQCGAAGAPPEEAS